MRATPVELCDTFQSRSLQETLPIFVVQIVCSMQKLTALMILCVQNSLVVPYCVCM